MNCVAIRKALLVCGFLASVLYLAMVVLVARQWDAYSSASQTVSELSAIDAPTRPLWLRLAPVYSLLMTAFGFGVWDSGRRNRRVRVVGAVLMVHGVFGLFWPPMHLRTVLASGGATLTDTLHLVWATATVVLMMLAIGFGAAALGKRFRLYSFATIVILLSFGVLTALDAPNVQANLPTPWVGVWERINICAFLLWIAVLAATLLRPRGPRATGGRTALAA